MADQEGRRVTRAASQNGTRTPERRQHLPVQQQASDTACAATAAATKPGGRAAAGPHPATASQAAATGHRHRPPAAPPGSQTGARPDMDTGCHRANHETYGPCTLVTGRPP